MVHQESGLYDVVIQWYLSEEEQREMEDVCRLYELKQVDGASSLQVLSFLDTYSSYNQIMIYLPNEEKTVFVIE
ncbi:hypothetical protein CR513_61024, partial [Mucuna pruriens]